MSKSYKELKTEATELNLEFSGNVSKDALEKLIKEATIDEHVVIDEPESIDKEEIIDEPVIVDEPISAAKAPVALTRGQKAARAKKRAFTTKVVTITDNDSRENSYTSTVPVSCSNEYFDLPTMRIPLNVPVEVAQGYLNVLDEIEIPHHVVSKGGGTVTSSRKRYAIANS